MTNISINPNAAIDLAKAFAFGSAVSISIAAFGLVATPVAIIGLVLYCAWRSGSESAQ